MSFANPTLAFIEGLGGGEMMLIFFIVLLLFGGKKMPELARGLGKSMREFKKATAGVEEEIKRVMEEPDVPAKPAKRTPIYTAPPAVIEPLTTIDSLETPVAPPVIADAKPFEVERVESAPWSHPASETSAAPAPADTDPQHDDHFKKPQPPQDRPPHTA